MSHSFMRRIFQPMQRFCGTVSASPSRVPQGEQVATIPDLFPAVSEGMTEDKWIAREIQQAALRQLPLLVGELDVSSEQIELTACAAAPNGLTDNMKFFINGRLFDEVEYPIVDPGLRTKFSEVPGGGATVRARVTTHLSSLLEEPFFRIDTSSTGVFVPQRWRQAMFVANPRQERYPLPPAANMLRVIGDTSPIRFAMGGSTIFHNVSAYLNELGHQWSDFPHILDWGCGAGRLTRYLLSETQGVVYGADIDPDNIAWCKSNLTNGHFETVPLAPPTTFSNQYFDLVIGCSVLTHLTEEMQWAWLSELQRITRPGALLFLSITGPTQFAYNGMSPSLVRMIEEKGFVDLAHDSVLDGVIDDAEYYRSSFHSRQYIVKNWSRYFQVVAIEDAIAAVQDFVILRRR